MKNIILKFVLVVFLVVFIAGNAQSQETPKWITTFENQNATNTWLCFSKTIDLDKTPESAKTRIAVDSKYWLWINGEMVIFEGGVKRGHNPKDTYFDEIDLAGYLKKGKNTIAILLWYFGKEGFSYNPSGKAALFFDCNIDNTAMLYSDSSWRARVHPAYYTASHPHPNFRLPESNIGFDARYDIGTWWQQLEDSKGWQNAVICGVEGEAPWNKLHHRIIPFWKDSGLQNYEKVEQRYGNVVDTIIAYLPYNCHITPYMEIETKVAGEKVTMFTDYYRGGGSYNVRSEYIAKAGKQEYESLGWMNGQKVYYLMPKDINVLGVKYRETSYHTEFAGVFECSDNFLNRFLKKAKRTLCVTMRDTYMDCPDRERAQWWGDLVNESGEAFYALDVNSHLLMKKGMYELIGWQEENGRLHSPIPASNYDVELPGQMLASIGYYGFWNYYMNTGDLETIKDLYAGAREYLKMWSFNEDGSLVVRNTSWVWGDWGTNIDKKALLNAWYYIALKGARCMAEVLGKMEDVQEFQLRMDKMKIVFNTKFWDGRSYRHPDFKGDIDERVNALAVVSGIADKSKYSPLLKVFKTQQYASPYMEKYVTEALFVMGQGLFGLERMKNRFGFMVNHEEYSTLFEGWGIGKEGFGGGTTNHAWSGGGLTVLAQYVCGIWPLKVGYKTAAICPLPSGIRQAKIDVATVAGKISSYYHDTSDRFKLEISVPSPIDAVVGLQTGIFKEIYFNNVLVWKKGRFVPNDLVKQADSEISDKHILFKVPFGHFDVIAKK